MGSNSLDGRERLARIPIEPKEFEFNSWRSDRERRSGKKARTGKWRRLLQEVGTNAVEVKSTFGKNEDMEVNAAIGTPTMVQSTGRRRQEEAEGKKEER